MYIVQLIEYYKVLTNYYTFSEVFQPKNLNYPINKISIIDNIYVANVNINNIVQTRLDNTAFL